MRRIKAHGVEFDVDRKERDVLAITRIIHGKVVSPEQVRAIAMVKEVFPDAKIEGIYPRRKQEGENTRDG